MLPDYWPRLPTYDTLFVIALAKACHALVFWVGGYEQGWVPLLMPWPEGKTEIAEC